MSIFRIGEGGSRLLRNVGKYLPDLMASHPKRQYLQAMRILNLILRNETL
jgi:hypothetical protein